MKIDIRNREQVKKDALKKLNASDICEENKKRILEFVDYKIEEDGIEVLRQIKYIGKLRLIAEHLEMPFDKATKADIQQLVKKIYSLKVALGKGKTPKEITESNKADYLINLKTFFKWLKHSEHPEETEGIKIPKGKRKVVSYSDMLTWEDIVFLTKFVVNSRDKAFIQVLWESGARIEELLTLLIKDVEVVHNGRAIVLHLTKSKTELRSIGVVRSAPALINWLENHPMRADRDAPLWVNTMHGDKPLSYPGVRSFLLNIKDRAKFNKPMNPHNFRKSSASYFSHILTESETKKRFGWTQDSPMLSIYCHPDENRINEKIMEFEGIIQKTPEEKQKEDERLKPKRCAFCEKLNPVGQEYCVLCKRPLNAEINLLQSQVENAFSDGMREFTSQYPELLNKYFEFMRAKIGGG